ncbi:MAG: MBL fold metallo-hydrolase [Vicinamibacteria bacterium]|nr:MBL fold metallo-hydrolase [Vicinamibacteria bacterium]
MRIFTAAAPPFMKNGYLVADQRSDAAVLIDPGDEVDDLIARAADQRLVVQAILLTHAHLDHITGVAQAKAAFDVDTWLHRDDDVLYRAVEQQGLMFGLRVKAQPPVDRFYQAGQQLTVGGLTIAAHATPGHSPGGVCLEVRDDGATELFVGDTLFAGSIGRTDLPGGDYETLIRSIETVLFAFPDDTPAHPGHGPSTTIGQERRNNPFLSPESA